MIASNLLGDGNKYQEIINDNQAAYPTLLTSNNLDAGWELRVGCGESGANENSSLSEVESESAAGYKVKVKVLDQEGQPVEGAKVTIHSKVQEATTDQDGIAHFADVEPGDHRVLIAYKSFEGEQSVSLTGDVKEFALSITVQESPLSLSPLACGIIATLAAIIVALVVYISRRRFTLAG